ncbi:hypothetical protein L596_021283 [Steinernema carpocapsae]|uniref:Uncharacterized protein n=1 Tax=Steinernema carpocapsae TaxID=34508 RepID=A0A4U5MJ37_STECR|nr:hypothetical protein L596_021283 [Steinernema carpocapsae]
MPLSFKLVQDYERSLMFYEGSQRGHNITFHLIHMFLLPGPRSPICTSGERCQGQERSCQGQSREESARRRRSGTSRPRLSTRPEEEEDDIS